MRTWILVICAALMVVPLAHAADGKPNRMKVCAAEYRAKNMAKSEYRAFMKGCLKTKKGQKSTKAGPSSVKKVGAPAPRVAPQDRMKACNADATAKALMGDAREAFLASCLAGK